MLSTHMLEQVASTATDVLVLEEGAVAHAWTRETLAEARAVPGGLEAAFMVALGHGQ